MFETTNQPRWHNQVKTNSHGDIWAPGVMWTCPRCWRFHRTLQALKKDSPNEPWKKKGLFKAICSLANKHMDMENWNTHHVLIGVKLNGSIFINFQYPTVFFQMLNMFLKQIMCHFQYPTVFLSERSKKTITNPSEKTITNPFVIFLFLYFCSIELVYFAKQMRCKTTTATATAAIRPGHRVAFARCRVSRNLRQHRFPPACGGQERRQVESQVVPWTFQHGERVGSYTNNNVWDTTSTT